MLDTLLIASALLLDGRAPALDAVFPTVSIVASVERSSVVTLPASEYIATRETVKVREPREIYFKSAN